MDTTEKETRLLKKRFSYSALVFIAVLILGLTLPFHYVPGDLLVFPKDNLTMSNTFIFQSDIDSIIEKYNKAGFIEKAQIRAEPLTKKLFDHGILMNK
jgi:hypothetical protein